MIDRSRRRLLSRLCVGAGAAILFNARGKASAPHRPKTHENPPGDGKFVRPLRMPGRDGMLAKVRLSQPIGLAAGVDTLSIFPGGTTNLWNYSMAVGGARNLNPLLIVKRGEMLDVTLDNRLGQDTTIHWHGLAVDEANDGSGLHPVRHGERRRYAFRVDNRAGLYWYHAHPHFHTGEQVHQGLASLLLVEDDEELALRKRLGLAQECDIPLLIADKQIARRNELAYKAGADDWIGNRVLVNWVPEPYLDVKRCLYRFRLANVSNARMFRPAFMLHGKPLPFHLIGTDGGLLEKPLQVTDCFLAPAQRIDVLLDLADVEAGARVRVQSLAYEPMENDAAAAGEDPMLEHPGAAPMGDVMDLMELRVGSGAVSRTRIPQKLSSLPPAPSATTKNPTRRFHIRISEGGRWMINDWNFLLDGHAPGFEVTRGSREIWEFSNEFRSMPHPLHLHGFQFRVVQRTKSPRQIAARAVASGGRTPQDLGLLDTVVVWPGETVRIALDFSQPFSGPQTYMLHCHNLEHEDQGMMVAFVVRD